MRIAFDIMPPVRCRVCRHTRRDEIEADCAARSLADVATAYGLSELALERHLTQHAPASGVRPCVPMLLDDEDDASPPTLRSPGQVAA